MDPQVPHLVSKVAEVGQDLSKHSQKDENSAETRHWRRELLDTSRRLINALQNEGQIIEGYLYGVI